MGFLNILSEWLDARYEKNVAEMEAQGLCPDCRGKGFNTYSNEYFYTTPYDCPSCHGSGLYHDWADMH